MFIQLPHRSTSFKALAVWLHMIIIIHNGSIQHDYRLHDRNINIPWYRYYVQCSPITATDGKNHGICIPHKYLTMGMMFSRDDRYTHPQTRFLVVPFAIVHSLSMLIVNLTYSVRAHANQIVNTHITETLLDFGIELLTAVMWCNNDQIIESLGE